MRIESWAKRVLGGSPGEKPNGSRQKITKRSVNVEADCGPLGVLVTAANVNDHKLLQQTIRAIVIKRPEPTEDEPQHLRLDKVYRNKASEAVLKQHGYTPHVRRIGEEKLDEKKRKRHPARRWVVERTLAWLSKCRGVLVRYCMKSCNHLGLIQLACALLWYR